MNTLVTDVKHLYRALFRETSYLFDPNARTWCRAYISDSFRRHVKPTSAKSPLRSSECLERLPSQEESRKLKRGRKFLALLKRANLRQRLAIEKVLKLTYGRIGRRRRELVSALMTTEIGKTPATVTSEKSDIRSREWQPDSKVIALMKSQNQVQQLTSRSGRIKISPAIPAKNAWGRPMPRCRVKNMNKRWFAKAVNILLPPLPEPEWQQIHDLATGKKTWGHAVNKQRRPRASTSVFSHKENKPTALTDLGGVILEGTKQHPKILSKHKGEDNAERRVLTPRVVKRIYSRAILSNTPLARAGEDGSRLRFKWDQGSQSKLIVPRRLSESQNAMMFG